MNKRSIYRHRDKDLNINVTALILSVTNTKINVSGKSANTEECRGVAVGIKRMSPLNVASHLHNIPVCSGRCIVIERRDPCDDNGISERETLNDSTPSDRPVSC